MRGGTREGAGRKAKEPTKVMRVPLDLVVEVDAMIVAWRKHNAKQNIRAMAYRIMGVALSPSDFGYYKRNQEK